MALLGLRPSNQEVTGSTPVGHMLRLQAHSHWGACRRQLFDDVPLFLSLPPKVNKHTFKTERFQKGKCFQLITRQPVSCQEGLCLHSPGTVLSAALHLFKAFFSQTPPVCDQNSQDLTGELSCPILEDAENSAFILM